MPTRGIWAPWPGAQLLLALFFPFVTRGGGIALAMAKPLIYPRAQLAFSPRAPRFPGCGRRFHWEALPRATPRGEKGEGGWRGALCLRSPQSQVPGTLLPWDQPSQRVPALLLFPSRLPRQEPLWPVKLSVPPGAAPAVASLGSGDTRAAEPACLGPGWPGAPSFPVYECIFYKD